MVDALDLDLLKSHTHGGGGGGSEETGLLANAPTHPKHPTLTKQWPSQAMRGYWKPNDVEGMTKKQRTYEKMARE